MARLARSLKAEFDRKQACMQRQTSALTGRYPRGPAAATVSSVSHRVKDLLLRVIGETVAQDVNTVKDGPVNADGFSQNTTARACSGGYRVGVKLVRVELLMTPHLRATGRHLSYVESHRVTFHPAQVNTPS